MDLRREEALVIVLSGKARSGKDTSLSIFKKLYESKGKKVISLYYASYIKEYAKNISNWSGSEEDKPRELLQVLGTDIIRNTIDKKFFINRIIEDIKVYSKFFDVIIIGDARFPDEIDSIKEVFNNVISVHINRKDMNLLTSKEKQHITETALDSYKGYDYEIENNGTLEELEEKLSIILKEEIK